MDFNFRHYIKYSNQLNEFTLTQLKGIVEEYPYFQMARFLYLKNLSVLDDSNFECELKNSAVYVYNRPLLHDFLFEQVEDAVIPPKEETEEQVEENKPVESAGTVVEEETNETLEEDETFSEESNAENLVEEKKDEEDQPIKRDFSSNIKHNISDILHEQLKAAEKETDELEISQFQMDVEKEYGKDLEKVSKKQEVFELLDDEQETEKVANSNSSEDRKRIAASVSYAKDLLDFDYVLRNTINYKIKKEDPNPDTIDSTGNSFTKWLETIDSTGEAQAREQAEVEKEEELDTFTLKNQIIENFIQSNPSLKPEDKPFEFEDISTESVKEDGTIVTDTLARIYYNQGRYDKALEAYKKLSLKYPEKNSYFATQIEKIKNKINDLK